MQQMIACDKITLSRLSTVRAKHIHLYKGEDRKEVQKDEKEEKEAKLWKGIESLAVTFTTLTRPVLNQLAKLPRLHSVSECFPSTELALSDEPRVFAKCKVIQLSSFVPIQKVCAILMNATNLVHFTFHFTGRHMINMLNEWPYIVKALMHTKVQKLELLFYPAPHHDNATGFWWGLFYLNQLYSLRKLVIRNLSLMCVEVPCLMGLQTLDIAGAGEWNFHMPPLMSQHDRYRHLRIQSTLLSWCNVLNIRDKVDILELNDKPNPTFNLNLVISWIRPRFFFIEPVSELKNMEEKWRAPDSGSIVIGGECSFDTICQLCDPYDLTQGRVFASTLLWNNDSHKHKSYLLEKLQPLCLVINAELSHRHPINGVFKLVILKKMMPSRLYLKVFPQVKEIVLSRREWSPEELHHLRKHCNVMDLATYPF